MSAELLTSAIDALVALDDDVLASSELVVALAGLRARLDAVACRQAVAFDRVGRWRPSGAQTSPDWVAVETRVGRRVAKRLLRVGHAMVACPQAGAAFEAGAIGVEHVEVLSRARDRNRSTAHAYVRDETMLVDWARSEELEDFRVMIDAWVIAVDTHDAERRAARQHERRGLWMTQDLERQWYLYGELDPVAGDALKLTIDAITAELYANDRAEARARLGGEPCDAELSRTPTQRRADALVEMARRARTAPAGGRAPKPLVTILVGQDTFATMCRLASGEVLTPGEAARVLDDAVIERITFDSPDRVVSVSRRRTYHDALRRAIEAKSGHRCTHPYCRTRVEHCQIDHIDPHNRGGPTSEANGRLHCGFHNRRRNHHPDPDDT